MGDVITISGAAVERDSPARTRRARLLAAIRAARKNARGRRVVLAIALILLVNVFDLTFTIMAHDIGDFYEENPLVRGMLGDPGALTLYKLSLAAFASVIFFVYRRRLVTEIACWGMCAVYTALAFVWLAYFSREGF